MSKLRVGLLFGGRSVEHEVSIVSATSILAALDTKRYDITLIGVDPQGRWHMAPAGVQPAALLSGETRAQASASRQEVLLPATPEGATLVAADKSDTRLGADLDVADHGRAGRHEDVRGQPRPRPAVPQQEPAQAAVWSHKSLKYRWISGKIRNLD